jgi:protein phosphatase PTC2/3
MHEIGIWDVMDNQNLVNHIREGIEADEDLIEICKKIMKMCVAPMAGGIGCDNMTIAIICLLHEGETWDAYRARLRGKTHHREASEPVKWQ